MEPQHYEDRTSIFKHYPVCLLLGEKHWLFNAAKDFLDPWMLPHGDVGWTLKLYSSSSSELIGWGCLSRNFLGQENLTIFVVSCRSISRFQMRSQVFTAGVGFEGLMMILLAPPITAPRWFCLSPSRPGVSKLWPANWFLGVPPHGIQSDKLHMHFFHHVMAAHQWTTRHMFINSFNKINEV